MCKVPRCGSQEKIRPPKAVLCASPKAGLIVKLSNCRIMHSVHVSIPDATHTQTECTAEAEHEGRATEEVQASGIGATNRGTPHVADAAHIEERAIVEAVATNGPFQC